MSRHLDNWLVTYQQYTSNLEAPDKFHFWAGVAAIAGALRGKVWVDMGHFRWRPNFFILYVAPPGVVNKSTTIGVSTELLRQVDGITFGPDSCTWQGVTDAFAESTIGVKVQGQEELYEMSAITVVASELGTFFDPKNREMVDLLVDLWDGRQVPWKRRTRGEGESKIVNPWFNFVGCTTPAWVAENFPTYAIGGGFASRTVFIYGERKRQLSAYPQRTPGGGMLPHLRPALINDLKEIAELTGEFKLTEAAYKWGEDWYEKHWLDTPEHLREDRMGGYVARKQTHMHKLAIILSAAQRSDKIIHVEDLDIADKLLTSIEEDLKAAFGEISDSREARQAGAVLKTIIAAGTIKRQALWKRMFVAMSYQEFESALSGIIAAGLATQTANGNDLLVTAAPPDKLKQIHDSMAQISEQWARPSAGPESTSDETQSTSPESPDQS